MASARICDRCGQVYSGKNKKLSYVVFTSEGQQDPDLLYRFNLHEERFGRIIDLCEKCNDLLIAFMKGEEV